MELSDGAVFDGVDSVGRRSTAWLFALLVDAAAALVDAEAAERLRSPEIQLLTAAALKLRFSVLEGAEGPAFGGHGAGHRRRAGCGGSELEAAGTGRAVTGAELAVAAAGPLVTGAGLTRPGTRLVRSAASWCEPTRGWWRRARLVDGDNSGAAGAEPARAGAEPRLAQNRRDASYGLFAVVIGWIKLG